MLKSLILGVALAVFATLGAAAEDGAPVVRGTGGLAAIPFTAENGGASEIACSAALAHWYSLDLGRAAAGGRIAATLWYDPRDGNVFLLNGLQDRMPVQALWCGLAGRSWVTRAVIGLERKAESVPAPIHVTCRPEAEKLACR